MDNTKTPSSSADDNTSADTTTDTNTHTNDTNINNNHHRDQFLRHLNKLSHKISKPPTSIPAVHPNNTSRRDNDALLPQNDKNPLHVNMANTLDLRPPPPPQLPPSAAAQLQQHQQQQPPVYNINKSDFRDVVQKLTGSPAHPPSRPTTHAPPHLPPSKPTSSRLQRIRPPPLLAVPPPSNPLSHNPHSPLPPLPSCHVSAAAESPISSYFRFLHGAVPNAGEFPPPTQGMQFPPFDPTVPPPPLSPLPFGCLPSPKSPSPLGFPPHMPISSPK